MSSSRPAAGDVRGFIDAFCLHVSKTLSDRSVLMTITETSASTAVYIALLHAAQHLGVFCRISNASKAAPLLGFATVATSSIASAYASSAAGRLCLHSTSDNHPSQSHRKTTPLRRNHSGVRLGNDSHNWAQNPGESLANFLTVASAGAAEKASTISQSAGSWRQSALSRDWRDRAATVAGYGVWGALSFKLVGGSFRSLMPSDLCQVGRYHRASLPALGGFRYATAAEKQSLGALFRRDGCHHCGTRLGKCVADHQPPNRVVHGKRWPARVASLPAQAQPSVRSSRYKSPLFSRLMGVGAALGSASGKGVGRKAVAKAPQWFLPQCESCSKLQAVALRLGRLSLVTQRRIGWPVAWWLGGLLHSVTKRDLTREFDHETDRRR